MILLEDITKTYETRRGEHLVLDSISLTIERGQHIGIMGRNGSGKSTLTRIITGAEHPTTGNVWRGMSVSWPLGFAGGILGSLTGADNARFIARIYGAPIERTVGFVTEFAELSDYFYMPIKTYSSGMRARLSFAISLAIDFDCYVIDEITAVGDHRFTERCRAALAERRRRCALIMVSHQPKTLKLYCDSVAILQNGRLFHYDDLQEATQVYHGL